MLKIKALALSTLVAGLLFGVQSAHVQTSKSSVTEGNKAHRSFPIPKPMEIEHKELHSALAQLTKAGGRTGKENEYALPPLSLLVPLSQGKFN